MSSTQILVLAQHLPCSVGWQSGDLERTCT